jgi:hypothetical protein
MPVNVAGEAGIAVHVGCLKMRELDFGAIGELQGVPSDIDRLLVQIDGGERFNLPDKFRPERDKDLVLQVAHVLADACGDGTRAIGVDGGFERGVEPLAGQ